MVKYSRMEENKRVYEEQYDTDEYEALTCECHHQARAKELNGSRRKPFFCIYCKSMYKDKNKLNLHRLEGCFAVTNDGRKTVLKIYPMFGKGQRGEIEDILIKHGLMSPRKKPSRAKRKKAAVAAAALKESGSIMDAETSMQEELTQLRPQKLKVRGMLSAAAAAEAPKKRPHHLSSSESVMQIPYGHHDEPVVDYPNGTDSAFAVGRGEMQVQMQLTREQVEAQAWEVAKAWEVSMLPDAYHLAAPPEVVPCPGLCHLMRFQLLPSDFPDVREDSFLQAFFEFVDKGSVDSGLRSSYGTWYMERETDADEAEQNAVKLTMSRFKLVQGRPDLTSRHKEMSAVQTFLQYQKECAHYGARKEAAEKELQSRRESYVKEKLEAFDARVQAHKEVAVWNWSPLLHILKSDPMGGVPPRPWSHSDAEHKKIAQAVLMNRSLVVSDPPRCPVIVRLFKIVYLYCFEKNSTLSDPVTGLLRDTMLGYSASESAAPVLRISAQSVLNEGSFLFADLPPYSEAQAEVFQDINALLHGTAVEREAIVQKVQGFLKVVRLRAIGDMAQLHPREFRVLWCGGYERQIADALKRFMVCLKSREDLDMGWVPFPAGHPDSDSVAVMLAREAVLKAIHKLHDQRVLSDKTRFLAASAARLPPSTNEKFQALVETCVVQKSQGNSANGSPGTESPEDDSKPSSYSTTSVSVATTQQDSRSSPDVKDTGMDVVERPHRFNSSPDLNLSLDSNPETDSPETTHMPSLNGVNSVKTVSVLGIAVQTSSSDRPPFPLHFYGPGSDVQSALRVPEKSASDPTAEYARRVPLLFSSSATAHKDDSSSTLTRRSNVDKEQ